MTEIYIDLWASDSYYITGSMLENKHFLLYFVDFILRDY